MTRDEHEDALRAQLDAAGVEYDGRWGVERLQDALDAAKAPDAAPAAAAAPVPAPAASAGMILCRVLRDFWPTDSQEDRVRKGEMVEVTIDQALDGVESGALQRVR